MLRVGTSTTNLVNPASYRGAATEQLPQALSQEVVSASVNALNLVREHRSLFLSRSLVMQSTSCAAMEPLSGAPCSAISTVGTAAVLGVLKCLPFECPSLTVAPIDTDRNSLGSTGRTYAFAATPGKLENWCVQKFQFTNIMFCRVLQINQGFKL